ncbi:MAG: hypothetical protein LKM39_05595 [Chiayiivirga sp.]|nr:hypothetical protein [Chiayiivirga sp.]
MIHIFQQRGEADERHFRYAWEFARSHHQRLGGSKPEMAAFRTLVRRQALLMRHDAQAALAAIPALLAAVPADLVHGAAEFIAELATRGDALSQPEQSSLQHVLALFESQGGRGKRATKAAGATRQRASRPMASKPVKATPKPKSSQGTGRKRPPGDRA